MRLWRVLIVWTACAGVLGCNCDLVVDLGDAGIRPDAGRIDAGGTGGGGGATDGGGGGAGGVDAGCAAPTSCYSGAPSTDGMGVCRRGVQQCRQGMLGPCIGEVLPSVESCNGADDNCNGVIDDPTALGAISCGLGTCTTTVQACSGGRPQACVPKQPTVESCANTTDDDCDGVVNNGCDCTYVAPNGNDTTGNGTANLPFASIQTAINAAGSSGLGKQVCVASLDPACSASSASVASYDEAIVMRDGVSVFGGYRNPADGGAWSRPPSLIVLQNNGTVLRKGCVTVINAPDEKGVVFPHNVANTTSLDGFSINGAYSSDGGVTAAVSVQGSTGALINDDLILGGMLAPGSAAAPARLTVGVLVDGRNNPSTPMLTGNAIIGGQGVTAIGVYSLNGAPRIQDSCSTFDSAGRCLDRGCDSSCFSPSIPPRRFIRARPHATNVCPALPQANALESYAVRLENSPGALIARSTLCTSSVPGDSAAVRLSGNAAGVVIRASRLEAEGTATGATNAVGFWADSCNGAAPWLINNPYIAGAARSMGARGDGVRAVGDCAVRVDSNIQITGGIEAGQHDAYGVYCGKDPMSKLSSRCTVSNNTDIVGCASGQPPISAGVRCDDGACARIDGNARISARAGRRAFGILLGDTNTLVTRNAIEAGCAVTLGVGVLSNGSFARIENNVIGGSRWTGNTSVVNTCGPGTASAPDVYGMLAILTDSPGEVQVNNNHIFAFGTATSCVGRALGLDVQEPCTSTPCLTVAPRPPSSPRGIFRNNILHAGFPGANSTSPCATTYAVEEAAASADPRVFENNDLWFTGNGATALYRDEATANLLSAGQVNALTDLSARGNLSVDPLFTANFNFPTLPLTAPGFVVPTDLKLNPTSSLVDAGTSAAGTLYDFYLTPRPQGGAWDIGAHEQ